VLSNDFGVIKLRRCKRKLERLNKIIISYTDMIPEEGFIYPETLKQMLLISEIDELLTDVIYYIIDNNFTEK